MNPETTYTVPSIPPEKPEHVEKIAILRQKITTLIGDDIRLDPANSATNNDTLCNFARTIEQEYGRPEAEKYRAFHLLIRSTPRTQCDYFDFPGEDSVEAFIERLYNERPV